MFEPEKALAVLTDHGVEFIVIGGFGARLFGASRPTSDVDVFPNRTSGNLQRLATALKFLDARIRVDDIPEGIPFSTSADALAGLNMLNLTTRYGDLDIVFEPEGMAGYAEAAADSVVRELGTTTVRVASLARIIESKETAGRPKDAAALPELHVIALDLAKNRPGGPPASEPVELPDH